MITIIPAKYAEEAHYLLMEKLITVGGQIKLKPEILQKQIRACAYFGFVPLMPNLDVVACAAIKTPQPKYLQKVFDRAGAPPSMAASFIHEVGYCVTLQGHEGRGYCAQLIQALVARVPEEPLFATTHTDAMRHLFSKLGWTKLGAAYVNEDNQSIDLFIYQPKHLI